MSDIDPLTGLPKELSVMDNLSKDEQRIRVRTVARKFGKLMTLVEGLDEKQIDVKDVAKKLKSKLACGGTAKSGIIELQGNHVQRAKDELIKMGFKPEMITIG